ncbi:PP2C family protein-serine/threonine phosphatase [Psychrobacter sp. DM8]|uniref:PP2C family protein-serine/threonine phosphatase n=1 Tax=Psychrobacter sp. DM8 TaxID=3440636 RepID=UPI003F4F75D0
MTLSTQICAITFTGNVSHGLQQDAFAINDDYYQETLGVTEVQTYPEEFCVAVADGVAASNKSQYVSKAIVKSIARQWQKSYKIDMSIIHTDINCLANKYIGASSTLALVYCSNTDSDTVFIKHVGDSRVYLWRKDKDIGNSNEENTHSQRSCWQALTYDHNLANQFIKEHAEQAGIAPEHDDFNPNGMASSLYVLTECFTVDDGLDESSVPSYDSQTLNIKAGDCLLVCSDGIHDLVPCVDWQDIDAKTDLQDWLENLRTQVYQSEGNAYDNGTAIVVRFG